MYNRVDTVVFLFVLFVFVCPCLSEYCIVACIVVFVFVFYVWIKKRKKWFYVGYAIMYIASFLCNLRASIKIY